MKSISLLRSLIAALLLFSIPALTNAQASCATAVDLTQISCSNGDLQNAVNATPTGSCGGAIATTTYGVWYKFTASATTATITFSTTNTNSNLSYNSTYIEILTGVCGSLTARNCQAAGPTATTASPLSLSSLTIGTTYYIRLYVTANPTTNKRQFLISLQQTPANDLCSAAIQLTSYANTCTTTTTGTLSGATASSPAVTSSCTGTPGGDVWYTFIAKGTNATVTLSGMGSSFTSTYIQILSGTCGSFTSASSLGCVNGTSLQVTNLTIGAPYYVRIYSTTAAPTGCNWNFNICVTHTPPPANDDCSGVTSNLSSSTSCTTTSGTLLWASMSSPAITACGTTGADVWYSFVASSKYPTINLSSIGTDLKAAGVGIQLFSGACGSSALGCTSGTAVTSLSLSSYSVGGLTIGNTYYIRIYTLTTALLPSSGLWTFSICVQDPPVNDECSGAAILTPGTTCTTTSGDFSLTNPSSPAVTSSCAGTPGADMWYKFVASSKYPTINLSSIGSSLSAAGTYIQLFSGTCGSTALGCTNGTGTTLSLSSYSVNPTGLTIGNTYYIRIYTATTAPSGSNWTYNICVQDPPANDESSGAVILTPGTTCTTTAGSFILTNPSNPVIASSCAGTPGADVWYSFVATNTYPVINLSTIGANLSSAGVSIQLLSSSFTSLACVSGTSASLTLNTYTSGVSALTVGSTYYIRIYTLTTTPSSGTWAFNICVQNNAANDDCSGAISLTSAVSCSNTSGTLYFSTPTTGLPTGCESSGTHYDVWYKFSAQAGIEVITISGFGANITSSELQLYSGTCGSLTSVACGTTSIAANNLVIGNTYYVRVSNVGTNPSSTSAAGFSICVYHPTPGQIDYSKSYVNITKGSGGGTVDPGDILEIRAIFVVNSGTADSLSFLDTLYNGKGYSLVPGSIALRTNEGKIYKSFTDAFDTDAGWAYTSGSDTVIRINFGTGATASNYARGSLLNTSKPSFYGNTCIIMATYRVQVYGSYGTKVNFKTGYFTYRDKATGSLFSKVAFQSNYISVYQSPGLCPNATSSTNAVGIETNGTFGAASGTSALVRNRGTSAYTAYKYDTFYPGNGPNDLYYGVPNNTSAAYTTLNTWAKPDNSSPSHRVFGVWDIIGDHTNASNTATGNTPCDTTKPVSTSNPCGYMLVINSSFKTDTAFNYTVTNLCPNTYYEISAWFRNICYKCGCDSNGTGASQIKTPAYIPFATGDSSGVQPNLAFDVDGSDYYTTGNLNYYGTTPTGSDATNKWVKRGFTYLTGAGQTSLALTIRNNAPGGGGNDWAMDDISVYTCTPNMQYSPTINPSTCMNNTVIIRDTVTSYFSNYNQYKWQRSTNGGTTWTDITGQSGSATPTQVTGGWRYITSYTIPPASTQATNNGDKYRVMVATTTGNLANSSCQFTDPTSIINLTVLNTCTALPVKLLSFNGNLVDEHAHLFWTVSREQEHVQYGIEKSVDGVSFTRIGLLNSRNLNTEQTQYNFTDTAHLTSHAWYRIALIDHENRILYSRSISLSGTPVNFTVANVLNPFHNDLPFDVATSQDGKLIATLYTLSGVQLKQQSYTVYTGMNGLSMTDLKNVAQGMYLLQVQHGNATIIRKVIKQ